MQSSSSDSPTIALLPPLPDPPNPPLTAPRLAPKPAFLVFSLPLPLLHADQRSPSVVSTPLSWSVCHYRATRGLPLLATVSVGSTCHEVRRLNLLRRLPRLIRLLILLQYVRLSRIQLLLLLLFLIMVDLGLYLSHRRLLLLHLRLSLILVLIHL